MALNEIALVFIHAQPNTHGTITPASGFTEAGSSPALNTNGQNLAWHAYWKRQTSATGAGETTGTYGFSFASVGWREAFALRYTGCITTGDPFDATNSQPTINLQSATTPAVTVTTTGPDRTLVWGGTNWSTSTLTTLPTGFTTRASTSVDTSLYICDKTQASAGSSGSLTGVFSTAIGAVQAWVGALLPVPSAPPADPGQFLVMF
jgi:hypothetical protein